jgi:hypothetical protein
MTRLSAPVRGTTGEESTAADASGRSSGLLRKLLAAAAVAGLAYVVSRRLSAADAVPSVDEARARATEAVPDRATAPAAGGEAVDESDAADLPGKERSDEEIAERAEQDIDEAPAEPGEMTVDEDVVEDIVDEAIGDDERELAEEEIDEREMAEKAVDEHVEPAERSSDDTEKDE